MRAQFLPFPLILKTVGISLFLSLGCTSIRTPATHPILIDGKVLRSSENRGKGIEISHLILNCCDKKRVIFTGNTYAPGECFDVGYHPQDHDASLAYFDCYGAYEYKFFPVRSKDKKGKESVDKSEGTIWKMILIEYPPMPAGNPQCLLTVFYPGDRVEHEWHSDEAAGRRRVADLQAKAGLS